MSSNIAEGASAGGSSALEREAGRILGDVLSPLAEKYLFDLPPVSEQSLGKSSVLVLGNHSSGKSAFINHVLGREVQRTGLAPVDDGFTIITHSDEDMDIDGPALVNHPEYPYSFLERFGPGLVSRVKLKGRPVDLLREVTLIDSPGMIDSAETSHNDRGYDFMAVVRRLAEAADVVLLFFDPDKPGTTGETLSVLRDALAGMDHKLLVVMNKVDRFDNMRDFARAYGALCWNLARTMRGKDLPHIYSIYVPVEGARPRSESFPLTDFDRSREELLREIGNAPARRAQNIVSDLVKNARMLLTHVRVVLKTARDLNAARLGCILVFLLSVVAAVGLGGLVADPVAAAAGGFLLVGGTFLGEVFWFGRRKKQALRRVDETFEEVFALQLARRDPVERADLLAAWEETKPRVLRALQALGPANVRFLFPGFGRLARLQAVIEEDIPRLRVSIPPPGATS